MKKVLAAVIFVMVCAGSAMAAPCGPCGVPMGPGPVMRGNDLPAAARAQMEEMRKLHDELMTELKKDAPDKAKAREIHNKIVALRGELDNARFEEMLKNPKPAGQPAMKRGPEKPGPRGERPKLSPEAKAKFDEMMKLNQNIKAEMQKEFPNKAKIRDWAKSAQKIRNDFEDARLEKMLKDPAKYKDSPMFGHGPMGPGGPRGPKRAPDCGHGPAPVQQ